MEKEMKSTTLQLVFSQRQVELLQMLIDKKGVTQSDIIHELIDRVLDECEKDNDSITSN
jgi:predicted DNA-binding protein